MNDGTEYSPVETATPEKATTSAPANADDAVKHDESHGNATEYLEDGKPHNSVIFETDDGDRLWVGTAWADGRSRDDMLAYIEVEECTGATSALVLSPWQVENLKKALDNILDSK